MILSSNGVVVKPLSPSALARFRKCELLYLAESKDDKPTTAALTGLAGHKLILEGRSAYAATYTTDGPVNLKTGKPFGLDTQCVENWQAKTGLTVITPEMSAEVEGMAASVWGHERASNLLRAGTPEAWVEADYCGIPCHGRLDWLTADGHIADLKTCADLDWFEADARRYGYIYNMAFYRSLVAIRDRKQPYEVEVFFIAVEKLEPFYRAGVWRIGQDILGIAQRENEELIGRLKKCRELNQWRTGYENIREFDYL